MQSIVNKPYYELENIMHTAKVRRKLKFIYSLKFETKNSWFTQITDTSDLIVLIKSFKLLKISIRLRKKVGFKGDSIRKSEWAFGEVLINNLYINS